MKEESGIRFAARKKHGKGLLSLIIAVISFLLLLLLVVFAVLEDGESGLQTGVFGMLSMAGDAVALYFGLRSFRDQDSPHKITVAGIITAAIGFVLMFCLYITGI